MAILYLCYDCLWPIWFPYGQKMHIGTGWYCWEKIQQTGRSNRIIKFKFNTPRDKLNKLFKDAVDIYISVKNNPDKSKVIKYLNKQIRYNRGDVIQKFLTYLTYNNDRDLDSDLCTFFRSRNWENFIDRQFNNNK